MPRNQKAMNRGITPIRILSIIGAAILIVFGALYSFGLVSINRNTPTHAPEHPSPMTASLNARVVESDKTTDVDPTICNQLEAIITMHQGLKSCNFSFKVKYFHFTAICA